jgi:hypothetical protein
MNEYDKIKEPSNIYSKLGKLENATAYSRINGSFVICLRLK